MKLEREVSSVRGWEDIWLAAEREMAHWQVPSFEIRTR